jgi:hypothetical protein
MPAKGTNGISLGVVKLGTVMPLRNASSEKFMVILGSTDKSKRGRRERWMAPEADLSSKIINFEQGREALEKGALGRAESCKIDKEHSCARGLPYDRLELLLTMAIFFAALLGLYVGLIGS